jgi:hypothetical protein
MSFIGHKLEGLDGLADAAKSIMKGEPIEEKKLDPVGQADADIDNDGDVDASDEYLKKRRAAISKAIKDREEDKDVKEAKKAVEGGIVDKDEDGNPVEMDSALDIAGDVEVKDGEEEEAENEEVAESTEVKENRAMDAKLSKMTGKKVAVTTPSDKISGELVSDGGRYYVDGYDLETFNSGDVKAIRGNTIVLKKDFMPEQTTNESKMKELHGMIDAGMTAKEIAKELRLKPDANMIKFLKSMGAK